MFVDKGGAMADRTEGNIEIDAASSQVMDEILDFESYPEWTGEIKKVEIRERDEQGRATQVYYEVVAAIINSKYVLSYTYPDSGAGMAWTLTDNISGPVRGFDGEYVLESTGETTKVTYRATMDLSIPMMGFMKRQAEKQVIEIALKGLKKRVEGAD